jgi:outer membrane protein OmpU
MNNVKKIGFSALAGSLVAFSAQAVEMSVSGSAKITYENTDQSEVTGNPYGMNTSMAFSGTGDVNGYETTLMITSADSVGGMSSAAVSVNLGDMGMVHFDQGVGKGGISTIDDKTPSAYEEVWDGLDAVAGTANALVGGGNAGVFVYSNTFYDTGLSIQYGKGASAANTDDASSGASSGSSWDFAATNSSMMDGLDVGFGYGKIANNAPGANGDDIDEHMVAFINYTFANVTAGYTQSQISVGTQGGQSEHGTGWGVSVNLMENLSASYGEREVEHQNASAAHVTEDMEGMAVAYTMGSATISFQNNETGNNGGTNGTNDENTEIALSLSF